MDVLIELKKNYVVRLKEAPRSLGTSDGRPLDLVKTSAWTMLTQDYQGKFVVIFSEIFNGILPKHIL